MERIKVILIDCYGTLIDWERGMYENLEPLFDQKTCPDPEVIIPALVAEQYRLQNGDQTLPFPIVLEEAYRHIVARYRLHYDLEAAQALGRSVGLWPTFGDSAESLARLKALGLRVAVLVNADSQSFTQTRKYLDPDGEVIDAVYIAQDIGSYKPDLRNFHHALGDLYHRYDVSLDQVLCVAQSKSADIQPANKLGITTARINRPRALTGHDSVALVKPNFEFQSLEEFTEEMERVHGES